MPREADSLKRYDLFKTRVESFIEMPDSMIDLLFNFLKQNNGHLSKWAKEKEFSALTAGEVDYIEKNYAEIFQSACPWRVRYEFAEFLLAYWNCSSKVMGIYIRFNLCIPTAVLVY